MHFLVLGHHLFEPVEDGVEIGADDLLRNAKRQYVFPRIYEFQHESVSSLATPAWSVTPDQVLAIDSNWQRRPRKRSGNGASTLGMDVQVGQRAIAAVADLAQHSARPDHVTGGDTDASAAQVGKQDVGAAATQ
jgi:hypothetical protein